MDKWSSPISRSVLTQLTGRTARTQRNYQEALGPGLLKSRQNAVITKQWERGDQVPEAHFIDKVGGELVVLRRMPNSYRSSLRVAPRGMMRRVNGQLNAGKSVRICGTDARTRERLFYTAQRAAQRRLQAVEEGDQFFVAGAELNGRQVTQSRCGAALWSRWTVADGRAFFD